MTATYHHGDLPRALLSATAELVVRDGLGGVSLRAVAREVGVSHSAPLHHFGDKEGLLTAFALEGFDRFADVLEAARTADPDAGPFERLDACGRAYVDFALTNRGHFEVMFRPELFDEDRDDVRQAGKRSFQVVVTAVSDCVGPGEPGCVERLALAAWASVHGLATLWVDGPLPHMVGGDRDAPADLDAALAPVLAAVGRAVSTG